jgi:hypothetical protein
MKLKRCQLAAAQSMCFDAWGKLDHPNDALHQRAVASGVIQQGQPQSHEKKPAQGSATSG